MKTSSTQSACPQRRHRYRYQSLLPMKGNSSSGFSIGWSLIQSLLKQRELFNDTIVGMKNQFQRHFVSTSRAGQRVFPKALEEPLSEMFHRQDPIAVGVVRQIGGQNIGNALSRFSISHIGMQAVVSDSLEALWQDVLCHPSYEPQCRQRFVFDLSGFVVAIPVADGVAVISFDSSYGDWRGDDIFREIFCKSFSAWRDISRLDVCDEPFGIIFPAFVDIFFDSCVVNIFSEHVEQIKLPLSVHEIIWDVGDRLPFSVIVHSASRHEDVKVRVVLAGASCGLKHDDVAYVEFSAAACFEDIIETSVAGPHKLIEQLRIVVKPFSQEFWRGQNDVAIDDARYETTCDEVGPTVCVSFCAGEAETGFAGECNAMKIAAIFTTILSKAHFFGVAAVEHFFDDAIVVRRVEFWVSQYKGWPVVTENTFKNIFAAGVIHDAPLQLTITKLAA